MANVDSVKLVSDERGFELHLWLDEMPEEMPDGGIILNIHSVAVDLLAACEREIAPWHREGMKVLAEMKAAGAFECGPDDIDESGGYDRSDPKHPDWHSVHADHYDNREKAS